jgi:TRAP-type C4-dicarboxylate transport system permease small subunit
MGFLKHISAAIKMAENFVGISIVMMMIFLMLLQVIFRYALGDALAWTEELNRLAMVWLGFIGAAIAIREREHIQIEVLYQYVSERIKKVFRAISYIIVVSFSLFITVYGFILISSLFSNRVGALDLPLAMYFIPVPLSGLLFLYHMICEKSQKDHTTVSFD